jgi:hypothetical protein
MARGSGGRFVNRDNVEHRSSGIGYATPAQRSADADRGVLAYPLLLYSGARAANPRHWASATRDWAPRGAMILNSERDSLIDVAVDRQDQGKRAGTGWFRRKLPSRVPRHVALDVA